MISIAIRLTSLARSVLRPPPVTSGIELLTEASFVLTTESDFALITE